MRKAKSGDERSLAWLVGRFSPWLLIQAKYRLTGRLSTLHDPEDLVQEVWMAALPRLPDLSTREGRHTPTLVKFLSTVLIRRLKRVLGQGLRERRLRSSGDAKSTNEGPGQSELAASISDPLSRLARQEQQHALEAALEELGSRDRELLVLRGIEQHAYSEIGAVLGLAPNTAAVAYRRALQRLAGRIGHARLEDLLQD